MALTRKVFGQLKNWVYTLNNPTQQDYAEVFALQEHCNYSVFQCEEGQNGTPHLQGYVVLKRKQRLSFFKKWLPRAHLEGAFGDHSECAAYCQKLEGRITEPVIFGTLPPDGAGARTDLAAIQELIKSGGSERDIAEQFFGDFVRYHGGISKAIKLLAPIVTRNPDIEPDIKVYWGPTGSGKSRRATSEAPDAFRLQRASDNNSTKYFEGYMGQREIIIDDFYGWIQYDLLLRLLDRYPLRCLVHYGSVEILATKFIITSNKHPRQWYRLSDVSALLRRLPSIEYLGDGITGTTTDGRLYCHGPSYTMPSLPIARDQL